MLYAADRLLTASPAPPDLGRLVAKLHAPTLLIAAGRDQEARFGRIYAERSHGRARPLAGGRRRAHAGAAQPPRAYEGRVTAFFDRAVLPASQ